MHKIFKSRALTPMFDVIVALGRCDGEDLSYDSLEEALGRSHRTLQYVVGDLASLGLIEIARCSDDRRRRSIRLTEDGHALLSQCSVAMFHQLSRIMAENSAPRAFNPAAPQRNSPTTADASTTPT